jgi:hypothetical protein
MSKQRYFQLISITVLLFAGSCFAYSGGTGEPNSPYQIATVSDWNDLMSDSNDWSKNFIMVADVNLLGVTVTPVGNFANGFTGVFDGNNHIISHVDINMPDNGGIGLFGYIVSGAQIRNLGVKNVNINGSYYVGGLAGFNGGSISNCYSTGSVSGGDDSWYVGGLVGYNNGDISKCYSTGQVSGHWIVGGLVGWNWDGSVENCYSTGSVNGTQEAGGLVGEILGNFASISNCYSTSEVNGSYSIGGLVGQNWDGSISNCYSTGSVSAYEGIGGLIARNMGVINNSFWDVNTSGQTTSDGGTGKTTAEMHDANTFLNAGWDFVGETANGTDDIWIIYEGLSYPLFAGLPVVAIPNVTGMTEIDALSAIADANLVAAITTAYSKTVPAGNVIQQNPTAGSLVAKGSTVYIVISLGVKYSGGTGEPNSPYQIATKVDLLALADSPADYGKCFILTADINMAGQVFTKAIIASDFVMGNYNFDGTAFTGTFDGSGHKIINLTINSNTNNYIGLFGRIDAGGTIKNLGIEDVNIIIIRPLDFDPDYTGGLCGEIWSGSITNCYSTGRINAVGYFIGGLCGDSEQSNISNCFSTAKVTGFYNTGGLCGASDGNLRNCYSTGQVDGSVYTGGLCGGIGGNVTNCYSTGNVSGDGAIGGLCGGIGGDGCNVTNCYSTGNVSGKDCIGGLVGENFSSYINNCFSTGSVTGSECIGGLCAGSLTSDSIIINCYSTGQIVGDSNVGGLLGICYDQNTVIASFWDVNTSGRSTSAGGTGKTTAQMKTRSTFTSAGWDFSYTDGNEAVWYMAMNGYPILTWQISPADIYTDGKNNFLDFAVLARYWMRDDCRRYNDYCEWADLNFDGSVDIHDLAIFMTYWLQSGIYE